MLDMKRKAPQTYSPEYKAEAVRQVLEEKRVPTQVTKGEGRLSSDSAMSMFTSSAQWVLCVSKAKGIRAYAQRPSAFRAGARSVSSAPRTLWESQSLGRTESKGDSPRSISSRSAV